MKETPLKVIGKVRMQVFNADGTLDQESYGYNLITNAGKAQLALLAGTGGTAFSYIAVGTSATAVAVTDTALGAEIVDSGLARALATMSRITTSVTNDTAQWTYTWSVTGTKTVQEVGIFNASSGGTMLGHKLTGALSVVNGQVLLATYTVQFT